MHGRKIGGHVFAGDFVLLIDGKYGYKFPFSGIIDGIAYNDSLEIFDRSVSVCFKLKCSNVGLTLIYFSERFADHFISISINKK